MEIVLSIFHSLHMVYNTECPTICGKERVYQCNVQTLEAKAGESEVKGKVPKQLGDVGQAVIHVSNDSAKHQWYLQISDQGQKASDQELEFTEQLYHISQDTVRLNRTKTYIAQRSVNTG